MAFVVGDLVVVSDSDGTRIGEVVAVRPSPAGDLYDVCCERATLLGLLADELTSASEAQVRTLLTSLQATSALSLASQSALPDARTLRDLVLAHDYQKRLDAALKRRETEPGTGESVRCRFERGELVAVIRADERHLARVIGSALVDGRAHYRLVDDVDEIEEADASIVFALDEQDEAAGPIPLGTRMRMAGSDGASGADFEGIICAAERLGTEWRYALAFDDGDVFCDLTEHDLEAL